MATGETSLNYCSYWFDGEWPHCCLEHDVSYEIGANRFEADWNLFLCVAETGNPLVGSIMLIGVVLFGWIFYKKKNI